MESKSSSESVVVDISKFKHSAFFATSDGQGKLFKRTWMPEDYGATKKATVLFLHGLADHCSRYSHVFEQLAKSGLQVESFDQRGFGYSGGESTWTDLISDIEKEYSKIGSELPKFIYAVHAGAVAAIHFIAKHADKVTDKSSEYRVDGLVAAAPYLKPKVVKSAVRRSTMKLKGIVKPKTTTSIIKNFSLLSRDPETVKNYEQDKQATKRTSIIFLNEVLEKGEQAQKQAQQIKIPVLVIQGAKDEIADGAAVKLFFDHLASSDKQHESIPELFHDIHHEPEKDKVIADVLAWMLKYLPPPAEAKSPSQEKKKKKKEKKAKKEKKEKTGSPEPRKEEALVENGKHEEKLAEPEKAEQTQQESVEKKSESPTTVKQPVPGKKTAVDFEFLGVIGRGAFGEVHRIKDIKSGQEYAVKMLNKKFIQESGKAGYVHTERNIFNKLNHPNVVKLSYTFQDPNTLFYVLELCPNGSLVSELQKVGRFSENSVRFYIAELVSALEHMHSKGVIHRDLKPDNVLLGVGMHVKLTDFGTSKDIGTETRTRSDSFHGTEEFVSPELLDDESPYATKASDLWALGCIMYQLLAGKVPFKGETTYQTFQLIKKREFSFPSDISEEAKDLVDKLLVLDPEQRLGAGEGGYQKLKSHPFFNGIDFSSLHTTEPPKVVPPNAENVTKQEEEKPKKEKKEKKSKKNQD